MIVVVAGIISRNGKIMLCQRRPGDRLGLKWEFPGGKMEPDETLLQALERELREELSIETRTGRIYDVYCEFSGERRIMVLFFRSELLSGTPQTIECNDMAWVEPEHLAEYDLAPADARVAERLAREASKTDI